MTNRGAGLASARLAAAAGAADRSPAGRWILSVMVPVRPLDAYRVTQGLNCSSRSSFVAIVSASRFEGYLPTRTRYVGAPGVPAVATNAGYPFLVRRPRMASASAF